MNKTNVKPTPFLCPHSSGGKTLCKIQTEVLKIKRPDFLGRESLHREQARPVPEGGRRHSAGHGLQGSAGTGPSCTFLFWNIPSNGTWRDMALCTHTGSSGHQAQEGASRRPCPLALLLCAWPHPEPPGSPQTASSAPPVGPELPAAAAQASLSKLLAEIPAGPPEPRRPAPV